MEKECNNPYLAPSTEVIKVEFKQSLLDGSGHDWEDPGDD